MTKHSSLSRHRGGEEKGLLSRSLVTVLAGPTAVASEIGKKFRIDFFISKVWVLFRVCLILFRERGGCVRAGVGLYSE